MRIAFVAHHGSLHTRRWVEFFARRGHDVHVVTCGGGEIRPEEPYEVHDLGEPRPGKPGYLLRVPGARRVVRRLHPDLVHAHFATSYGLLALCSGARPLVVTAHGDDVLISPRNPAMRAIVTRVLRAAALVTVPSAQMRDAVLALARPETEVDVFQYGVESARLARVAATRSDGAHGGPVRVVSARPLLALYRFDVLLEALALLAAGDVDWVCDLYGDGPERPSLERRAARLGLGGRVVFHGRQPPADIERAFAAADVFVSVAESDGASIALLEALALGPVPVLSDIPSNREWVRDGENGVLTPIEAKAVAAALARSLALDRRDVARANAALVAGRADRDTNLTALESRLEALVAATDGR